MVGMQIGITGEKELLRRLRKARSSMKNFRPWLKQSALIVIESLQTNFDEGGRPAWVALAADTIRKRGIGEILRDTGILMASVISPRTHEDGVYEINNFSIEVGTTREHAATLHYGTIRANIPPRPFMFMQEIDKSRINTLLVEFLDDSLGPVIGAGGTP